jgi:hypothetical protein
VTGVQLVLPFGRSWLARLEAGAAEEARRAERAAWQAQFDRPDWVAPWDTQSGMKKGDRQPGGWRCPDCGDVEPNEFGLGNNHGWHPGVSGWQPPDPGVCTKLWLQRNHALYDERKRIEEGRLL